MSPVTELNYRSLSSNNVRLLFSLWQWQLEPMTECGLKS